jgi:Questin oxidase-like
MNGPELGTSHDGTYDEALAYLHAFGPECHNGFVNHAPMAVEALASLGLRSEIMRFVRAYEARVPRAPAAGEPLPRESWAGSLGNARLYPRWLATFQRLLAEQPLRDVIAEWLFRLAPGCLAAAFHGPIMTMSAIRALEHGVNDVRMHELARGLGYWAATYQPVEGAPRHLADGEPLRSLLRRVPVGTGSQLGAIDAGVHARTHGNQEFAALVSTPRALEADAVGTIVVAGARATLTHPAVPIVFIHAITGPVAFRVFRRWLDSARFEVAVDFLWQAIAGLNATFTRVPIGDGKTERPVPSRERLIEAALATRDEHAIKVVEAALHENAVSGNEVVLQAAEFACERILASM